MKLRFYGATRGVTGSKHLVETVHGNILLDCGLFQGTRKEAEQMNKNLPDIGNTLNAVVLSHAHLDHCGALPMLCKQGFTGKIYMTPATADVAYYILMDAAHIQEQDIEYLNRKKQQRGEPLEEPLFTEKDIECVLDQFVTVPYYEPFHPMKGVEGVFFDAGHILGSAQIHLTVKEDSVHTRLAFTGDLGRWNMPIIKDPDPLPDSDTIITESTYGDRLHETFEDTRKKLKEIIIDSVAHKAKIVIPAFALGRTQEIIYIFHDLIRNHEIPNVPIYVDSPLSGNITEVFKKHPECFDAETYKKILNKKDDPFGFENLIYTSSANDSKAINAVHGPVVIISASGMCEYGRIRHHLANTITDPNNVVLITGFMAEHTLGRKLVEGEKTVKIWDEFFDVRARIHIFNGFSAHADYEEIIRHIRPIKSLKNVFLVHGEETQMQRIYERLRLFNEKFNLHRPLMGEEFSL